MFYQKFFFFVISHLLSPLLFFTFLDLIFQNVI
nr:MAG TPA: hypothetical protein [Caudoviricetes sp.]